MGSCFIFGAGTVYGVYRRPGAGDFVIAADAGYRACQRLGIVPDLLVGDFDSMPEPDFPGSSAPRWRRTTRIPPWP